ncbi:MAG TPA: hypothetical protein VFX96_18220 [Pyrinomonadaceae bacterium]|nr:hypothetical protein [Pyrinomonadaceae bacterium]
MSKKLYLSVALISASLITLSLLAPTVCAQQVADPDFKPAVGKPAYKEGRGPVVCVDEAHFNFHTAGGRYAAFATLLRGDGYVVRPSTARFTRESLKDCRVLVIANANSERNQTNWTLPIDPAFTDEEVAAVAAWVKAGGALFHIVDHMPMPGASDKLARAFGVEFSNGFALVPDVQGPMIFKRADGQLGDHAITRGRNKDERVERVATFTGSAFRASGAKPILVFGDGVISLEPNVAWQFTPETPKVEVKGWMQGAALRHGKGRVVVFGEAAMFTAQLAGPNKLKVGMNSPDAPENPRLLLNILHWLDGTLKDK